MHERERLQAEYNELPQWAKNFMDALGKTRGMGMRSQECDGDPTGPSVYVVVSDDDKGDMIDSLFEAMSVAQGLTAPMPETYVLDKMKGAVNVVEWISGDDTGFDQPCAFGHRVESYAVYCHNTAWPGGPGKCHRTWYSGGEVRDEDCAGFKSHDQPS